MNEHHTIFYRLSLLGAALLAFCATPWCAQAAGQERWSQLITTTFTHVAQDAEMPNSAIPHDLVQDRNGFLWMGTENGLARWDGYAFRIYKPDPADPRSLPDSQIDALYVDPRGTLWIGTDSAGLVKYDPAGDRFTPLRAGPKSLSDVAVFAIVDDGHGGILAGTNAGIDRVDSAGRVTHLARLPDRGGEGDTTVHALLRDRHGRLWAGTGAGVLRYDANRARFHPISPIDRDARGLDVLALLEDASGRIWAGTRGHGVYFVDGNSGRLRALHETGTTAAELAAESALCFVRAGAHEIWIGTAGSGIVAVDTGSLRTRRIRHDVAVPGSLPNDTILAMFADRSGLLWVATIRSLSHSASPKSPIATVFTSTSAVAGITDAGVRAVGTAGDRIVAGLTRGGFVILDPNGVAAVHRQFPSADGRAFRNGVTSFAADPVGGALFGTRTGLFRSSDGGQHLTPVALPAEFGGYTRAVFAQREAIWIAGLRGLWSIDRAGHARRRLQSRLTDERVSVIAGEPGGGIWIGTQAGLNRFDPRAGVVEHIVAEPANPRGLPGSQIATLMTDRSGRLWVGSQGAGIAVLTGRDAGRPRFTRIGVAAGLPSDAVDQLRSGGDGTVWASTDGGLARIDPNTFAVQSFDLADGVAISGYWTNSGATTAAGELVFGGLGGLTIVRPERVVPWSYEAPVVVTEAAVAGHRVPASRFNSGAATEPPLDVRPEGNSFLVGFAALDYSDPQRNRYAYKLDGFDRSWVDTDAQRRFAAYTNVPPGSYRLLVRGSNRAGVWNPTVLSVPVRIFPAWYQTPLFTIAVVCVAIAGVFALLAARTGMLRRRQRELEREVAARTSQLHATQRQLEQIAYFDTLTELPNRRMFAEDARRLIAGARRANTSFALVLLDLDGFKLVNDSLGHDAGDAVLVEASARLRAAVRESDCIARLGGDEFAILLAGDRAVVEVDAICRRIVDSFSAAIAVSGRRVTTTTSIGVALFPRDGENHDTIYKAADLALYDAKRAGRNTWRWYRTELRV